MLTIAVLGPLEVRRDGRLVPVPGGKASELLVRLALDAGAFVRADRLVEELWSTGTATRRNTLQSKVAMLRRALQDPQVIASGNGGYALAVDPSAVDALAVLSHTASASRLFDTGDHQGAADLCAQTLQLYRGELLQTAGDRDWVDLHRARLEEARTTLLEIQFSARLRLGDVGAMIGELEVAVLTHPFQERLWELLITALYMAGRQADALAAYTRIKDRLFDELGLDPGPKLQQLEQQILTQAASLGAHAHTAEVFEAGAPIGNLPSMSAELVGRADDLTALSELIANNRLVEIVGPGGIGKTAAAIMVGRRVGGSNEIGFDSVWLARLETAASDNDVIDTLIAALNVPGEEALFDRLKGATTLVILDNCEHVREAAATLAVRLLDLAPGVRIVCTSQVALDIDGEVVFELAPLALDDAVQLFLLRANTQRVSRRSSGGEDAVVDLCRSLDGLPLAIELAAARTKTLSVEEITWRLEDRLKLLTDPTSRRSERRRSLKSTIQWSYELLFPDDQRGLWALAPFAGGARLPAVESVLEALDVPSSAAIDVVGRLASRSLVIVDDDGSSTTADAQPNRMLDPVRYRLLDSIRAYSLEVMADAGLSERAFAAHAAWFADAAASSTQGVRSGRQAEHLAFVRSERANIDAALAWSVVHDPVLAVGIVNGFGWAWVVLGDNRGAQRILVALEAAGDAAQPRDRVSALLVAAWIEASTDRLERAREHVSMASELAERINDVDLQARCSYYLAYVVSHHGEFRYAMELTDRSRTLYDSLDRPWDQAANWLFTARAAISAGDEERSIDASEQVQHWLRIVDDPWLQVRGDAVLGELARLQHRFGDAVLNLARAAETSGRLGFQQTEAYQLASLGRAQCQAGDYDTGASTLELAINKAESVGDLRLAALARVHLGRVLRATGHLARARTALEATTAWHRNAGGGEQAALGECLLAAVDAADQVAGADERLRAVLEEARRRGDAPVEIFALDALARIAALAGESARARALLAAADRLMESASHFIGELDRVDARFVRSALPPGAPDSHAGSAAGSRTGR